MISIGYLFEELAGGWNSEKYRNGFLKTIKDIKKTRKITGIKENAGDKSAVNSTIRQYRMWDNSKRIGKGMD